MEPITVDPIEAPKEKPSKLSKKGANLAGLIDFSVVGLFGMVAAATGHEHWFKDREEVYGITEPLKLWAEELSPKVRKNIEKKALPVILAINAAGVIVPDVIAEARLRRAESYGNSVWSEGGGEEPGGPFPTQGGYSAPSRANGVHPPYSGPTAGPNGERLAPIPSVIVGFDA